MCLSRILGSVRGAYVARVIYYTVTCKCLLCMYMLKC